MKKTFLISTLLWVSIKSFSQTSINDEVCYQLTSLNNDAHVISIEPDKNYGQGTHLDISAGSWNGIMGTARAFIDFDWNKIPNFENLKLVQALLDIPYYSESIGNIGNPSISLKRITSKWSESTVTWNNQPTTVLNNNSIVISNLKSNSGIDNIDVTKLVSELLKEKKSSYGIQIAINDEVPYQSLFLSSSNYPIANKKPIMKVCFIKEATLNNFVYSNSISSTHIVWNSNDNQFIINTNDEIFLKSKIDLEIFDIDGKINKIENCDLSSGLSKVNFNPNNKSSLIILKLHSREQVYTTKVLMK